jgi:hypothetical protein
LQHLKDLEPLIKARLADLQETVSIRQKQGLDKAVSFVSNDSGLRLMDKLKSVLAEMLTAEKTRLVEENSRLEPATRTSALTFAVLAVLAVVIFCTFGYFVSRYLTDLKLAHKALTEHKNRLEDFYDVRLTYLLFRLLWFDASFDLLPMHSSGRESGFWALPLRSSLKSTDGSKV